MVSSSAQFLLTIVRIAELEMLPKSNFALLKINKPRRLVHGSEGVKMYQTPGKGDQEVHVDLK